MASLNKVFLMGNLTRDPELRRIPSGTTVSTLGLAVNESFTSRNGDRVERTLFIDVDVWDRQAETCQQYLSKGSPVFIEGRLLLDKWQDRETGKERSQVKVRAERVQFLGNRRDGGAPSGQAQGGGYAAPQGGGYDRGGNAGGYAPAPSAQPQPAPYADPLGQSGADEEIPF